MEGQARLLGILQQSMHSYKLAVSQRLQAQLAEANAVKTKQRGSVDPNSFLADIESIRKAKQQAERAAVAAREKSNISTIESSGNGSGGTEDIPGCYRPRFAS